MEKPKGSVPTPSELVDTEELRSFRRQWKQELQKEPSSSDASRGEASTSTAEAEDEKKKKKQGLKLYKFGLQAEKKGDFHKAVGFYRQAYKLDPQLEDVNQQRAINASMVKKKEEKKEEQVFVLDEVPPVLPETETSDLHISVLPMEVVLRIFTFCDALGVERSAQVCKNWLFLARQQSVWKELCYSAWGDLVTKHEAKGCKNFRRLFTEWPRLRFDGIYFSKNTYIRSGLTEGTYFQPVHQVYYYRYFRFFPDGRCVSATSFDKPKDVVQLLTRLPLSNDPVQPSKSSTPGQSPGAASAPQPQAQNQAQQQQQQQQHVTVMSLQAVRARSNIMHGTYDVIDESRMELSLRKPHPKRYSFNFAVQISNVKTIKNTRSSKLQVLEYVGVHDSGGAPDIFPVDTISRFIFTTVPAGLLPS